MLKNKKILLTILLVLAMLLIPNMVNAAVEVTKNVYANNGSAKFNFTGLTLDKTHEYEFGFTKTAATDVEKWHLITVYTETTATIDITGGTDEFADVILATETGYITIKDKTTGTIVLEPFAVDLSIPYLKITNHTVISNGKDMNNSDNEIKINFWKSRNSSAYYQYEKITDENVINKYKEIKNKNGNYDELQPLLKTTAPDSNWTAWQYWNGHGFSHDIGFGYPQRTITAPDYGLYYMWIYLAGNNVRNLYGYILVDNLQPEIALDKITLPATKEVELGKTLTLTPTFSPANTTNKIVTWSSSDESVATVNNAGVVTPKKVGSTIITVTSQDGNKKASCTVMVVDSGNNGNQDAPKKYIDFPWMIMGGKGKLELKSGVYDGNYTMYYQFVEISTEVSNKLEDLKKKYEDEEITYEEYYIKYNEIVTKYDDSKWTKTEDGSFEQDLTKFEGSKKFALWVKLEMADKTVYEFEIYTMNGSQQDEESNAGKEEAPKEETKKDNTTAPGGIPYTGGTTIAVATIVLIGIGIYAYKRNNDLKGI